LALCLQVELRDPDTLAVLGLVEDWEPIKAAARKVERVDEVSGWRGWKGIYMVVPTSGPKRHYLVSDM
jgi:hypothetical protein